MPQTKRQMVLIDQDERKRQLGAWIRQRRGQEGYTTLHAFGRALEDVSGRYYREGQVSNWETGRYEPDEESKQAIFALLGNPPIELLSGVSFSRMRDKGRYLAPDFPSAA